MRRSCIEERSKLASERVKNVTQMGEVHSRDLLLYGASLICTGTESRNRKVAQKGY